MLATGCRNGGIADVLRRDPLFTMLFRNILKAMSALRSRELITHIRMLK